MSLDGNGTYSPPAPQFPAIPNTIVYADDFNQIILDIATALSTAIFRDGQAAFTANQSMGGNKLTNLATGTAPQDAVNVLQVFTDPVFIATTLQGFKITGSMFQALMTTINLVASGTLTLTGTTLLDASASGEVRLPANSSIGNVSAIELAYLDGVTSAIQGQLNALSTGKVDTVGGTAQNLTLTGTPTAPTAPLGTNTNQVATMAALIAQAFSAALPLQTGNAGKFVTTDGTNASWTSPFPSQAGSAGSFLSTDGTNVSWLGTASQAEAEAGADNAKVMTALRVKQAINALAGGTMATLLTGVSTTTLLTKAQAGGIAISTATGGVAIKLPDATTLTSPSGRLYQLRNIGSYSFKVLDSTGGGVCDVAPTTDVYCWLTDNSTVAGVWVSSAKTPVLQVGLNTVFNNSITSKVASAGITSTSTLTLYVDTSNSNYVKAAIVTINDGVQSIGTPTTVNAVSSAGQPDVKLVQVSANKFIAFYGVVQNPNPAKARVLTVSGSTITVGAEVTVYSDGTNSVTYLSLAAINTDKAVATYYVNNSLYACVLSVSGTTITVNSAVIVTSSISNYAVVAKCATDKAVVAYGARSANVLTISGTTVSVGGTATMTSGTANSAALVNMADNSLLIAYSDQNVSYAGQVRKLDVSGTAITYGAPVSVGYGDVSGFLDGVQVNATTALIYTRSSSDTYTYGNTVSFSGAVVTASVEKKLSNTAYGFVQVFPLTTDRALAFWKDSGSVVYCCQLNRGVAL